MTLPSSTVTLLTFNQEGFVEDAFRSLLNQDLDNIEIVVSDDCSSDGTWEKIQEVERAYQGPKKIILSRNSSNIGIVDNFAAAVQKSTSELIFMAAGDDVSLPDRCSKSIQFWLDTDKKYDLVAADAFDMAYDGKILGPKINDNLENWTITKWFQERPFFFGASHMVTKRLLDLAPLSNRLPYEDQCLVFRAILMGGAVRLPASLVCHRRGGMTQKIGFQFGRRKLEIANDINREIAEWQQFLSDAILLNKAFLVQQNMPSQKLAYCEAVLSLFQSPVSIKNLFYFWRSNAVSISDKYRYTRYYLFYPVLAIAHGLRDFIRQLKSRY